MEAVLSVTRQLPGLSNCIFQGPELPASTAGFSEFSARQHGRSSFH